MKIDDYYVTKTTQRTWDAIITSLRQNDVETASGRINDVIITACVAGYCFRWDLLALVIWDITNQGPFNCG